MVNRQELEKEIDNLLDSMTDDELISWYDSKTQIDVKAYLGEGSYLKIKPCSEFIQGRATLEKFREIISEQSQSFAEDNNNLGMAA